MMSGCWLQRQQRKNQLCETVALFQMGIAGQNEPIDPQRHIFPHPLGNLFRIPDQRGARSAPHKADAAWRPPCIASQSALGPWCRSRSIAAMWSALARARPKRTGSGESAASTRSAWEIQ